MICGNCQIDKLVTDFINNQKFCYQCEYRIKLEKTPKKRTPNSTLCRMCGNEVIQKKNLKNTKTSQFIQKILTQENTITRRRFLKKTLQVLKSPVKTTLINQKNSTKEEVHKSQE